MNDIARKVKSIQTVWKHLTLIGAWLGTIAGSFLLPLPDWDSNDQLDSNTRFILFIATVIAGFVLLFTYKYKGKSTWLWISVITFILFIGSFYIYNSKRETNTLPYYGTTKVVGSIPLDNFENKIKSCGLQKNDKNLLKCVGGESEKLWTKESIKSNKNELILCLTVSYSLLAIFMISFMNSLILYTSKNEKT